MPLVTVVIPNFNHARFLERRIQSVLAQSFQDYTIVLLDDASTDGSLDVINRYKEDPRFLTVINERNSGSPFRQWNHGVSLASTPYIWIAETDDVAEPELLATLVQKLETHPDAVLAYCQSSRLDENDRNLGSCGDWTDDLNPSRWKTDFVNSGNEECIRYLRRKNTIPNASAVVFRREAFLASGSAPGEMRLCGDWLTWVRLLQQGDVIFSAQHLNHFRTHAKTVRSNTSSFRMVSESVTVRLFIAGLAPSASEIQQQIANEIKLTWWNALCGGSPPPLISLYRTAKSTSSLGWSLPLSLMGLAVLARLARTRFSRLFLQLMRPLIPAVH